MERGKLKTVNNYHFIAEYDWGCYNEDGEYLKGTFDKDGYNRHCFRCTDGNKHCLMEHRLKWEYFNGEIPDGMVIDHIIPISSGGTNKLSNLRLVTPKENANNPITKKNLSKALKGKYTGEKHWMYGKKHSEETKLKMSEIRSQNQCGDKNPFYGKHWNENQREANKRTWKPVIMILEDGNIIRYESATIAAKENNLDKSSICKACKGRYGKKYHNYNNANWYFA